MVPRDLHRAGAAGEVIVRPLDRGRLLRGGLCGRACGAPIFRTGTLSPTAHSGLHSGCPL